jgi:hypothetical protein
MWSASLNAACSAIALLCSQVRDATNWVNAAVPGPTLALHRFPTLWLPPQERHRTARRAVARETIVVFPRLTDSRDTFPGVSPGPGPFVNAFRPMIHDPGARFDAASSEARELGTEAAPRHDG